MASLASAVKVTVSPTGQYWSVGWTVKIGTLVMIARTPSVITVSELFFSTTRYSFFVRPVVTGKVSVLVLVPTQVPSLRLCQLVWVGALYCH